VQQELIDDCVHCGFCLPACPTYDLWHEEMDSPRGRIHLLQGLVDNSISLSDTVVEHFDRCLGCLACMPACPSGVKYDRLLEQTRQHIEQSHRRSVVEQLLRTAVFAVVPHRRRLRLALALRRLPAPGLLAPLKAIAPSWSSPAWPPERLSGDGPRVALVAGCVSSVVFGDANAATARVLQADGYDVHVPRSQGCCGALYAHSGQLDEGVRRARALVEALDGYDHIVVNAAGCGSHLKEHGGVNVVDVSELLTEPKAERRPLPVRVAYQDACHLRHAQRIVAEPRALLDAIPELQRLELEDQAVCCGSAGVYNIFQPRTAADLGDRKAEHILASGADAYASANPGCLVQVTAALRRRGRALPAFHPVELVDASIRGLDSKALLAGARR
jgi:glycolate oxidase iron-sulfur subunit